MRAYLRDSNFVGLKHLRKQGKEGRRGPALDEKDKDGAGEEKKNFPQRYDRVRRVPRLFLQFFFYRRQVLHES